MCRWLAYSVNGAGFGFGWYPTDSSAGASGYHDHRFLAGEDT